MSTFIVVIAVRQDAIEYVSHRNKKDEERRMVNLLYNKTKIQVRSAKHHEIFLDFYIRCKHKILSNCCFQNHEFLQIWPMEGGGSVLLPNQQRPLNKFKALRSLPPAFLEQNLGQIFANKYGLSKQLGAKREQRRRQLV